MTVQELSESGGRVERRKRVMRGAKRVTLVCRGIWLAAGITCGALL